MVMTQLFNSCYITRRMLISKMRMDGQPYFVVNYNLIYYLNCNSEIIIIHFSFTMGSWHHSSTAVTTQCECQLSKYIWLDSLDLWYFKTF